MKKIITTIILVLASFIIAAAQSTNPLNYSGRMYVEAIEIIQTPRYVSYEDHAILSRRSRIPSVKIMTCEMDFEKGTINTDGSINRVKVRSTKKYDTDSGWTVVIYMDMVDSSDKMELVWSQYGKPYAQQITPSEDGIEIVRLILSSKPYVTSESEALYEMLQNLGTM